MSDPIDDQVDVREPQEAPRPRMVKILVSLELLAEVLHVPEGHRIVQTEPHYPAPAVWLMVEGPDLPELEDGERPPDVVPVLTRKVDGTVLWDWNLEETILHRIRLTEKGRELARRSAAGEDITDELMGKGKP